MPDESQLAGIVKLKSWLNKTMRIKMTDGRTLIGVFVCTDKGKNVILGSCEEYLKPTDDGTTHEPRVIGLAMVPGGHIVSVEIDETQTQTQTARPSDDETALESTCSQNEGGVQAID